MSAAATPGCCLLDAAGGKSWTAKLLGNPALCCSKIREEAGELAATWEGGEGAERAASEAADLLYHSLVLLNTQASFSCSPDYLDAILPCAAAFAAVLGTHALPYFCVRDLHYCLKAAASAFAKTIAARSGDASIAAVSKAFTLSCAMPQGVSVEDVLRVLRGRFGVSGIAEKEARSHRR